MSAGLELYHRLPYPLRVLVASTRGFQLSRQRYGPETDRLAAEAVQRERWPPERWRVWQDDRLARLLAHAAKRVPYYKGIWEERRRRGDPASPERLESWPLLTKETIRSNPRAFLAEGFDPRRLMLQHTSGTSGTPLPIWMTHDLVREWYALNEARWRGWYGVSRRDRWVMIGGQLVTPIARTDPPFWVRNFGLRQLYLSAYHLAPAWIPRYVEALQAFRPRFIWGYSSALHALASGMLEQNLTPPPLAAAMTNAEPLFDHQRDTIERAFGCRVHATYGMTEIACAASECDARRLHLWPEAGVLEVLDDDADTRLSDGLVGRLVVTGLMNEAMPLIRYLVGDRGSKPAPADAVCPCGRTLPRLAGVEGRLDDVVLTPDGRRIGRLDPVFKGNMPIREAQIIQEAIDRLVVKVVPGAGYSPATAAEVIARLRDRVGDLRVDIEVVASIPRSANGKFRAVVSKVRTSPPTTTPAGF